jgi:hypothetical protein
VARNGNCPPILLANLAGDADRGVRAAVAANPRTPPATLARLAGDGDGTVRAAAAGNTSTPAAALALLPEDGDYRARARLAHNPCCPAGAVARLLEDAYQTTRFRALVHPACNARLVAARALVLAHSLDRRGREILHDLAYHPGFPPYLRPLLFLAGRRVARERRGSRPHPQGGGRASFFLYATEARRSVLLLGPPGIGKSVLVRETAAAIARDRGLEFIYYTQLTGSAWRTSTRVPRGTSSSWTCA